MTSLRVKCRNVLISARLISHAAEISTLFPSTCNDIIADKRNIVDMRNIPKIFWNEKKKWIFSIFQKQFSPFISCGTTTTKKQKIKKSQEKRTNLMEIRIYVSVLCQWMWIQSVAPVRLRRRRKTFSCQKDVCVFLKSRR
jgi:hypothetical protein